MADSDFRRSEREFERLKRRNQQRRLRRGFSDGLRKMLRNTTMKPSIGKLLERKSSGGAAG